jgi:hypothetical protein
LSLGSFGHTIPFGILTFFNLFHPQTIVVVPQSSPFGFGPCWTNVQI